MPNIIYEGRRYRSKLESMVGSELGPTWSYEPYREAYVTHRTYTPDFVLEAGPLAILVEVKGFFRVGDTAKYKAIRDALEQHYGGCHELVFYLNNAKTKVRKGALLNMGQWCEKEGFKWFEDTYALKRYAEEIV